MPYLRDKQIGQRGHCAKSDAERVLTEEQWRRILQAVKASAPANPKWHRDFAAIYLGYTMGLRVGEVRLLKREHFRDLSSSDTVRLPTLKQSARILARCDVCGKAVRVRTDRAGQDIVCVKCGITFSIPAADGKQEAASVYESDVPFVEEQVVAFVLDYVKNHMRPDQVFLIEGRSGKGISASHLEQIFSYYANQAGLSKRYSWHALRHGRGVRIWNITHDMLFVAKALRQKSLKSAEKYMHLDPLARQEHKKAAEQNAFNPLEES